MTSTSHVRFLLDDGLRVHLRALEEDDLPRCRLWINDPEIRRYLTLVHPIDPVAEQQWYRSLDRSPTPSDQVFAVIMRATGEYLGNIGLHNMDWVNRHAEVGFFVGPRRERRKGFMSEALSLLLGHAFDDLGMHRIDARVYSHNPRTPGLLQKAGFVEEGCLRERLFREGAWRHEYRYGLLASDWRSRREDAPPEREASSSPASPGSSASTA